MIQRTRKQITYAAGALIVVGLLLTGISILFTSSTNNGAQASPTPTPSFKAITVEDTTVIRHAVPDGVAETIDIVARLKNPNPNGGIKSYPVTFMLYQPNGEVLKQHIEETYILPGSLQYVMAVNLSLDRKPLGRVEVQLPSNPAFLTLPDTFTAPTFSTFMRERKDQTVGTQTLQEQVGIIKNTSTFNWQTVDVSVVGLSASGQVIAAGKTSIGALRVGEEREFNILWPKPAEAISRTIALPTTNLYRDENFIQTVGDPTLLH